MAETFDFLGLTGHLYGLCAAIAVGLLLLGMRLFKKLPHGTVRLFGVLAMVLGVIGARALYCVCNISRFTETYENPWLMLRFFDGGLSMPGMLLGLMAAAAITAHIQKISFAELMDAICLPLGLSIAVLRFGEQFTDLGVGKAVDEGFFTANLPWLFQQSRMGIAIEYRLNVWAYEAVLGAAICLAVAWAYRRLKERSGDTALLFFILYGASQIMLESMRDDGHMMLIFLRVGQLAAALMPIIASAILLKRFNAQRKLGTWIGLILCAALIVVLEFSLDGRLTIGNPTLARDYGVMFFVCAVMCALPCSLLLSRKAKA